MTARTSEMESPLPDSPFQPGTRLASRTYSLEQALKDMPLPPRDCTGGWRERQSGQQHGWCRCCYTISFAP